MGPGVFSQGVSELKTYRPARSILGPLCMLLLMVVSFVGGVLADRNCHYVHDAFDGCTHQHGVQPCPCPCCPCPCPCPCCPKGGCPKDCCPKTSATPSPCPCGENCGCRDCHCNKNQKG